MPIELRLLRYFAVVAEELHVGHAAARLYISQPALSQQIRALEDQVGLPLFVRHPRGVALTEAGKALLDEARDVLDRSDRLEKAVEDLRRGVTATLRIAVTPGAPSTLLPGLLAPLRAGRPEASVEVQEMTTPEQIDALHAGSIDLGLVREPVEDSRLARRSLLVEPLGVSLPAGHPLASHDALTLRQLENELFVCFPRPWAPSLHDVLVEELRRQNVDARFQDSASLGNTQGMVAAGLGLTLSARPWLEGVDGIVWRPLADTSIEIRTAAAWRPENRSPLLRELLVALEQGDAELPGEDAGRGEDVRPGHRHPA
jgi:DNA-binding transcriptional LysR family regulator